MLQQLIALVAQKGAHDEVARFYKTVLQGLFPPLYQSQGQKPQMGRMQVPQQPAQAGPGPGGFGVQGGLA